MNSSVQEKNQRDRKSLMIDHVNRMSPIAKAQDSAPQTQNHIKKVKLQEINSYLTCHLCKGYLIDATTISECLHSFCRSCIIKFLQDNSFCPVCDVIINKAKPNLKLDKTLQDIVYKLVPGLFRSEMMRRRLFYVDRPHEAGRASPEQRGEDTERTIFSPKDSISLSLEYIGDAATSKRIIGDLQNNLGEQQEKTDPKNKTNPEESLLKRYLQCPGMCRIDIIKKFICNKYNVNMDLFQIDVLYKRVPLPLPDHYTLIDVAYIYTWKRNEPMRFYFRIIEKGNDEPPDLTKVFTPSETPPLLRSNTTNPTDTPIIIDDKDKKKKGQKKNTPMKTLRRRKDKYKNDLITRLQRIPVDNNEETPTKNVEAVEAILADELKEQQRKCKRGPLIYDSPQTENRTENESNTTKDIKKNSRGMEKVTDEKKVPDANVFDFVDETLPQYNGNHNSIAQALKREPHYKNNLDSLRGAVKNNGDKRENKKNDDTKTLAQSRKTPDKERKSPQLPQPRKNQSYLKSVTSESPVRQTDETVAKNVETTAQSTVNTQTSPTPKNEVPLEKSSDVDQNSPKNDGFATKNEFDKEQTNFLEYFGLSSTKDGVLSVKDRSKAEATPGTAQNIDALDKLRLSPPSGKLIYSKTPPTQMAKMKETPPTKPLSSSAKRKKSSPVKNETKKPKLVKFILQPKSKQIAKPPPCENQDKNKLQALFQNCRLNIPSSLSITLKENDEVSRKPGEIPPVQNYIEILKIEEKEGNKATREESLKYSPLDAKKSIENRVPEPNSKFTPNVQAVSSTTTPNENQLKSAQPKVSNPTLTESSNKSKELLSKLQQHSFQKIFEESIKKSEQESGSSDVKDGSTGSNKRKLMDIARELSKKNKLEADIPDSTSTSIPSFNASTPPKSTIAPTTPVALIPKVAIPRINNQRVVKPPKRNQKYESVPNQTLTNLHSSSLGLNYTVSVGKQSKNPVQQTYKVNGVLSPQSCSPNNTNVEANKKSPSPRDNTNVEQTSPKPAHNVKSSPISPKSVDLKIPSTQPKMPKIPHSPKSSMVSPKTEHGSLPPVKGFSPKNYPQTTSSPKIKSNNASPKTAPAASSSISPASSPTLTPNQLLEKYNIQNLAQLSASINFNPATAPQNYLNGNQMAALQHSMFVKQIEMQNRHKWLNINQGILQFEKYLQSLSTNKILGNIKDN